MPFEVVHVRGKWVVRNKETGRVLGTHPGNDKGRRKAHGQLAIVNKKYNQEKK